MAKNGLPTVLWNRSGVVKLGKWNKIGICPEGYGKELVTEKIGLWNRIFVR
jgi:hypothetical protein